MSAGVGPAGAVLGRRDEVDSGVADAGGDLGRVEHEEAGAEEGEIGPPPVVGDADGVEAAILLR